MSSLKLEQLEERAVFAVGDLDPTFGSAGVVASTDYTWNAQAVQGDGKVVVVGSYNAGVTNDVAVMRLNADGSVDSSFGVNGIVSFDLGASGDVGRDVAIDANGDIVIAGSRLTGANAGSAFVARLDGLTGALDTTFDADGWATVDLAVGSTYSYASSVAVDATGNIVLAGRALDGADLDGAVARLTSTGALDLTFGLGGRFSFDSGLSDVFNSIAVRADGSSVAVGSTGTGTGSDVIAVGITSLGLLDMSFGVNGERLVNVATNAADAALDAAFDSAGRLVIAGSTALGGVQDMLAVRLTTAGALDATFGTGGIATVDLDGQADVATSLAIDTNGNIVLAGSAGTGSVGVVRLLGANGLLDTNFNVDGRSIIDLGNFSTGASVALNAAGGFLLTANGTTATDLGAAGVGSVLRLANPLYSIGVDGSVNGSAGVDVNEGSVVGTAVATLSAVGYAPGATLTWSLTSNPGNLFSIVDGQLRVNGALSAQTSATRTVTVQVTDGTNVATQEVTIDVNNLAPSLPLDTNLGANTVSVGAVAGTTVGLVATAADAGSVTYSLTSDASGRFVINPTTGVVSVASGAVFATGQSYDIVVQASDGELSASNTFTINVGIVATIPTAVLENDPLIPGVQSLYITGTTGNDKIDVTLSGGQYRVKVNGSYIGGNFTLASNAKIYINALDGNDKVTVSYKVKAATVIDGGLGNDKLVGGGGDDLILGGEGNDSIDGRGGRDVLIGGLGIDKITGVGYGSSSSREGNLMIGDATTLDANLAALTAIAASWSANDLSTEATVRSSLNASTVIGDGSADSLRATSKGIDWAFAFELNGSVRLDTLRYFRANDLIN